MSDLEDHPAENIVVKKTKKKRNYTPEARERMLKNLEKARAAASRSKTKNKEFRQKKRMLAKMKKDKARKAEEEALDAEYNTILGVNQKVSMAVQEPESSSEEEEPPPRRRKKKHKKKPRKAKKKVKYYYSTDESETSSEEWQPEHTHHLYSDQPRSRTRNIPQRDEVLQQHYQDRMGQIAHSYAPKQPTITTGMVQDMIFPPSPFGNL